MAAKITKLLIDKISKEYQRNPKGFNIQAMAIKYNVATSSLAVWCKRWAADIQTLKDVKKSQSKYTPLDKENPTQSINENATYMVDDSTRIIAENLQMANDISQYLKAVITEKIANNEELTYLKASSGTTDQYGRLTEYLKDIAVITNIASKFLQPEDAIKRAKRHALQAESDKNIPDNVMDAAEYYQDLLRSSGSGDDDEL